MKKSHLLSVLAILGTAASCTLCQPIRPGEEGEECTFDTDCEQGLICVRDRCTAVVADAGASDAATADGQRNDLAGTDLVGRDLALPDHAASDQAVADHAAFDHAGADLAAVDHAVAPDAAGSDRSGGDGAAHEGGAPDIGLGDINSRSDRGFHPDHALPDWVGLDWAARDLNVFVDGGGINVDAGIHSYDGGFEPGVKCGQLTCTGGQHCCIAYGGDYSCANSCTGAIADLACDDTQDCGNPSECCGSGLSTFCITSGTCLGASGSNYLVCTNSDNCATHSMTCCSSTTFAYFGVDLGWCQTGTCQ